MRHLKLYKIFEADTDCREVSSEILEMLSDLTDDYKFNVNVRFHNLIPSNMITRIIIDISSDKAFTWDDVKSPVDRMVEILSDRYVLNRVELDGIGYDAHQIMKYSQKSQLSVKGNKIHGRPGILNRVHIMLFEKGYNKAVNQGTAE